VVSKAYWFPNSCSRLALQVVLGVVRKPVNKYKKAGESVSPSLLFGPTLTILNLSNDKNIRSLGLGVRIWGMGRAPQPHTPKWEVSHGHVPKEPNISCVVQ